MSKQVTVTVEISPLSRGESKFNSETVKIVATERFNEYGDEKDVANFIRRVGDLVLPRKS